MQGGLLLLLMAGAASRPDTKLCRENPRDFCCGSAVIWCGTAPHVDLDWLASHAAPVLWFSPDEPLLARPEIARDAAEPGSEPRGPARKIGIPQMLALELDRSGHAPQGDPAVYWQVDKVLTPDGMQTRVQELFNEGRLAAAGVETLTLSYLFYYERDVGLNPHYHDAEGIELQLDFEAEPTAGPDRRRRVAVARVTGLGHGSELLSNILQVKPGLQQAAGAPDLALPITILVEEGKHASCPDRNGDGHYTPGYDVNVKVPDAWGVRDVFGSGVVSSRYREAMTKPRNPRDRIGPDPSLFEPEDPYSPVHRLTPGGLGFPRQQYRLLRAPRCAGPEAGTEFCRALAQGSDDEFVEGECLEDDVAAMAAQMAPGKTRARCKYLNLSHALRYRLREPAITGFRVKYNYGDKWFFQPLRYLAPAVRTDANDAGLAATAFFPYGLPKFAGWFMGRAALIREGGRWYGRVDLSFAPSLTRLADWYAAVGHDWGLPRHRLQSIRPDGTDGASVPLSLRAERRNAWALEAGLQMRFRAYWLRVGARASLAAGQFGPARVVAEVGWGPNPKHAKVH